MDRNRKKIGNFKFVGMNDRALFWNLMYISRYVKKMNFSEGGYSMGFAVGVGEADFAALRKENAYYVDKTEIIYELVHDTKKQGNSLYQTKKVWQDTNDEYDGEFLQHMQRWREHI
jgi:hypothetical protein